MHRLSGFIYYHYNTSNLPLPSSVVENVSKSAIDIRLISRLMLLEIRRLAKAIAEVNAPIVLLKGPVLSYCVYASPDIRPFSDIDLLTHTNFVHKIEKCLERLAYDRPKTDPGVDRLKEQFGSDKEIFFPLASHRPELVCLKSPNGPKLDIHHTELSWGNFSSASVLENAQLSPHFGNHIRVPTLVDLVMWSALHFYHHFRLNTVDQHRGALKFLADIFACLHLYLRSGDWSTLISRARDLNGEEILFYGLSYLNMFYGSHTVPKEVIHFLANKRPIKVPILVNSTVEVASSEELLKQSIPTAAGTVGPAIWMLHPEKVPETLMYLLKQWMAQGNRLPSVDCLRVKHIALSGNMPIKSAWGLSEKFSIDEESQSGRHFFSSHISYGVWPKCGGVRGTVSSLWNDDYLFLKTSVFAQSINYVSPVFLDEAIHRGEGLAVLISCTTSFGAVYNRIGLSIGQQGQFGHWPSTYSEFGLKIHDIGLKDVYVVIHTLSDQYTAHMRIPWHILNITPSPGLKVGFDAQIWHRTETMSPKTAISWSGGGYLTRFDPQFHPSLTLVST